MPSYFDLNTIQNPAIGIPVPEAWFDGVRTLLEYIARNKAHMRVNNSAAISIPNSTRAALTYDSERVDVGGMHSTVTNTSRGTVPAGEDGLFLAAAHVDFAGNATGGRNCELRLNGATLIAVQSLRVVDAVNAQLSVASLYQLAAADYIENTVLQTSGGALNVTVGSNYSPELAMCWLGV